ncbi:MAG: RecQ family zinc-binding domain-containing protein, partial [Ktedonobacteraceae bacterium]
ADQVELVAEMIQRHDGRVEPEELRSELGLSQTKITQILTRLEEVGVIEMLPNGEVLPGEQPPDLSEAAEEAVQMQESRRQFDRSRIEMMRGYAEVHGCRREYLLNYFGEPFEGPCGFCDNCEAGIVVEESEDKLPFPLNSRVVHLTWSEGVVLRYEGDKIIVLFDEVGYKALSLAIVMEKGLLKPAP